MELEQVDFILSSVATAPQGEVRLVGFVGVTGEADLGRTWVILIERGCKTDRGLLV